MKNLVITEKGRLHQAVMKSAFFFRGYGVQMDRLSAQQGGCAMGRRPAWWLGVLAKIWPITWLSARATGWPVIGRAVSALTLPLFSKRNLNISYIPINEGLAGPGGMPLPIMVVEELIRRSSHRVIIRRCTCRDARGRENHPVEIGCILLGDGSAEIDRRICKHVSADEAIAHLHRAVQCGLIPMTGRVKIDNYIWGVPDRRVSAADCRGKLLTVCFCCRCCCTILASGKYLPPEAASSLVRMKGLSMKVDTVKCAACGSCVSECFMGAVSILEGAAVHDEALCKGCGRCASVCPQGAVRIEIADAESAIAELMTRIDEHVYYK